MSMIVKLVDLYVLFLNERLFSYCYSFSYRHELFDNDFGVEFCEENDEQMTKTIDEENDENSADFRSTSNKQSRSIIIVKTVPPHSTRLPAHIWRSLAKVRFVFEFEFNLNFFVFRLFPVIWLLNSMALAQLDKPLENVREKNSLIFIVIERYFVVLVEKNLKLSGNRIRLRLKSGMWSFLPS